MNMWSATSTRWFVRSRPTGVSHAFIHSHGRLKDVLDLIVEIAPDALDPIEPPPQGDGKDTEGLTPFGATEESGYIGRC
jgi:hypothetical protein